MVLHTAGALGGGPWAPTAGSQNDGRFHMPMWVMPLGRPEEAREHARPCVQAMLGREA